MTKEYLGLVICDLFVGAVNSKLKFKQKVVHFNSLDLSKYLLIEINGTETIVKYIHGSERFREILEHKKRSGNGGFTGFAERILARVKEVQK